MKTLLFLGLVAMLLLCGFWWGRPSANETSQSSEAAFLYGRIYEEFRMGHGSSICPLLPDMTKIAERHKLFDDSEYHDKIEQMEAFCNEEHAVGPNFTSPDDAQ